MTPNSPQTQPETTPQPESTSPAPATAQTDAGTQPPVDNNHVAPGAEPFSQADIAANAPHGGVVEVMAGDGAKSALDEPSEDDNDPQLQEAKAKAAAERAEGTPPEGAPKKPEAFSLVAAVTVSKSNEDGTFFIQFDDGTPAAGAQNASQVNMVVTNYLNTKTVG